MIENNSFPSYNQKLGYPNYPEITSPPMGISPTYATNRNGISQTTMPAPSTINVEIIDGERDDNDYFKVSVYDVWFGNSDDKFAIEMRLDVNDENLTMNEGDKVHAQFYSFTDDGYMLLQPVNTIASSPIAIVMIDLDDTYSLPFSRNPDDLLEQDDVCVFPGRIIKARPSGATGISGVSGVSGVSGNINDICKRLYVSGISGVSGVSGATYRYEVEQDFDGLIISDGIDSNRCYIFTINQYSYNPIYEGYTFQQSYNFQMLRRGERYLGIKVGTFVHPDDEDEEELPIYWIKQEEYRKVVRCVLQEPLDGIAPTKANILIGDFDNHQGVQAGEEIWVKDYAYHSFSGISYTGVRYATHQPDTGLFELLHYPQGITTLIRVPYSVAFNEETCEMSVLYQDIEVNNGLIVGVTIDS